MSFWTVFLIATGGFLAFEGVIWAIFPAQVRRTLQQAFAMGDRALHLSGLVSVAVGTLLIMWAVKMAGV